MILKFGGWSRLSALVGVVVVGALLAQLAVASDEAADADHYWPQWRGPLGVGVAPHGNPPIQWSETKNIRWKIPLPGVGHSTPIVWGDRVYITAAEPYGEEMKPRYSDAPGAHDNLPVTRRHKFIALAIDRRDGKIIWRRTLHEDLPSEGGHTSGSLASASPVTDGERLFAYFGSQGLFCLDTEGRVIWKTDFGQMRSKHGHGEGSSPALHGDTLIVNWDHEGQSFVIALDKRTGRQIWKVQRQEVTSWATPIVVQHAGRAQVIVSGSHRVRSYDLASGDLLWQCGGLSQNIVASPVAADGMVFAASSYDTRAILAIRLEGAHGDITDTDQVVWSRNQRTPYVPSPLLYGQTLYYLRHYQGILTRIQAKTGQEPLGPFRLEGVSNVYASPVGAAGRVYITDLDGATLVVAHGEIPRVLALNHLDDSFSASAAIAGDELYLRGLRHLYCVARE